MPKLIFITGTDTEIGKTTMTVALIQAIKQLGYKAVGLKPIASGCDIQNGKLINGDALALQQASSLELPIETINPLAFSEPISPHLAARPMRLTAEDIAKSLQSAYQLPVDFVLIEGVGGWHAPINEQQTMADVVKQLDLPVIMVCGMRLGVLNHSILTLEAINKMGLQTLGWIANHCDPEMLALNENIQTLKDRFDPLPMSFVPYHHNSSNHSNHLIEFAERCLCNSKVCLTVDS